METERIDLRRFLGESLERLGSVIPDETVFTCAFTETPEVQANELELRAVIAEVVTKVCEASAEVRLRTGTLAGKSGPHAFVEVSRPDTGTRIVVPVPVFRSTEMRLAGIEPATSRSGGARSIP
jgi:hypothetical protein